MRFLTKAFIAVSALFFLSSADAFYYPASSSAINRADTHRHLSNIHAHMQSNHQELVATVKSIHWTTQTLDDCTSSLSATSGRSADKVKACLSITGSAAYDTSCAADLMSTQCTFAMTAALAAYGAGGVNSGGSTNGPSEECANALTQYRKNVETQCGALSSKFSGTSNPISTATDINSLITAQCTLFGGDDFKSCTAALSGFTKVVDACPQYNLDTIKGSFGQLLSLTDGPLAALCTKDDSDASKYCLATVLPAFQNDFDINKLNDGTLNTMCKPCFQTIVNKIASFGGQISGAPSSAVSGLTSSIKYFNVLCTKDPTNPAKYCFTIFASLSSLGDKAKTASLPTNDDFRAICSPCMKAIMVQGGDLFGAGQINALKAFENYCAKEPSSGNYCGATVLGKFTDIVGSLSVCDGTTCSDACKAAVSAIYSDQSCCFATVGFQALIFAISDIPAVASFLPKLSAASTCAIDVSTKKCALPAPAALAIDLSLPNIAYSKISGTTNAEASASIKAALQKDISFALGVDASAVIINDFSSNPSSKGGVTVSITINVDASFKSSYQSTINAKLSQSGGLPLPSTAEQVQKNNAALVAGEPVSAAGQAQSGAINNNASMIVIAIATVIAVFFNAKF